MQSSHSQFVLQIRVYLEDTDAQGVVYNASYFRFMERARTELLRARGFDHAEFRDEHNANFVLARIEARFVAPSQLSDILYVGAQVTEIRGARMTFAQSVRKHEPTGALVCEGTAEVACMDINTQKPKRFPRQLISEWV
jgi:acyl-CoA thioester hydrolase